MVLNITSALKPRPTGIARFVEGLVPALLEDSGRTDTDYRLGVRPHRWTSRGHSPIARRERRRIRPLVAPYRLFLGKIDLLHSLGAWLPPESPAFPSIVTIHDVHTIDRPALVTEKRARNRSEKLRRSAAVATAIVTPSEFTRGRVIELFDRDPKTVFAVHHGLDRAAFPETEREGEAPPFDRPFVLGSGQAPERKRGDLLIEAWERSKASREVDLILVGGRGEECPILEPARVELARRDRVHLLGHVPDGEMLRLYRHAVGCLQTSEYEGFGFPVLEAMALSCPLAATDIPAFREVVGDSGAAEFFEPGSVDACAAAIDRLVEARDNRNARATAGVERAREFSWSSTARAMADVYRAVLLGFSTDASSPTA
ncbi:MAG: glycosyltransferase family 1 protein [Verrucomicrobiota bacterium]